MPVNSCPFCDQVNPADAKFCNACGGALHLVPCPRCGAVSDVTATTCYQCNAPLEGRGTGEAEPMPRAAELPKLVPRRPQVFAGATVLAAIAVLGYYGYRQSSPVDVPQPPPASSDSAAAKAGAQTASPAAPPPEMPLADQADQQPEESRRPSASAGLIARPKAANAGKAGTQAPARQEVCTDAVVALGLCTMTPEDRELAEDVAAVDAAKASPEIADSGKAGAQGPADACTEAVAALGLCTPASKGKGKGE